MPNRRSRRKIMPKHTTLIEIRMQEWRILPPQSANSDRKIDLQKNIYEILSIQ